MNNFTLYKRLLFFLLLSSCKFLMSGSDLRGVSVATVLNQRLCKRPSTRVLRTAFFRLYSTLSFSFSSASTTVTIFAMTIPRDHEEEDPWETLSPFLCRRFPWKTVDTPHEDPVVEESSDQTGHVTGLKVKDGNPSFWSFEDGTLFH